MASLAACRNGSRLLLPEALPCPTQVVRPGLPRRVHGRAAGATGQPGLRLPPRGSGPSGWRQATARDRRTKADWAVEVAALLEGRYAECPKVTLVCDNLNTYTKGAFYEVFEPARARQAGSSPRALLHAEARELAERRRERTECDDAPMPARAPHRRPCDAARRSVGVIHRRQRHPARRRLADEGRRCAP